MFKRSILYTGLIIVLVIGGGCGQNEGGHKAQLLVSGNDNPNIPAEDKRCLETLTMLDKTGFETSVIITAKTSVIENTIDECLDLIITGSFVDK
jgi:hypothetical protein